MSQSAASPHVLVLMPTFNQAAFIARALASLQAQTWTNWQLFLINDGFTDQTQDAIAPYLHDPRIHVDHLEQNQDWEQP